MYLDSFDNLNSCNFEHFWLLWMFGTLIGLIILFFKFSTCSYKTLR